MEDWGCFSLCLGGRSSELWQGWFRERVFAKYCVPTISRWVWMGMILVSLCRCCDGVVDEHPVMMRRALFCVVWSLSMLCLDRAGCQMNDP